MRKKALIALIVAGALTLDLDMMTPLSAYLNEKIAVPIGSWMFSAGFGFGTSYEFGQQAAPVMLFAFCYACSFIAASGTKIRG